MTDDESQEAFIEAVTGVFTLDLARNGVDGSFLSDRTNLHFMMWKASAEFHTKRERERCAGIVYNLLQGDYSAARAVRLIEEPKP